MIQICIDEFFYLGYVTIVILSYVLLSEVNEDLEVYFFLSSSTDQGTGNTPHTRKEDTTNVPLRANDREEALESLITYAALYLLK